LSLLYRDQADSMAGVEAAGHEAHNSSPSGAEVKIDGAIPPLPIRLYGAVLNELSIRTISLLTLSPNCNVSRCKLTSVVITERKRFLWQYAVCLLGVEGS
jgi:hypothetical protein